MDSKRLEAEYRAEHSETIERLVKSMEIGDGVYNTGNNKGTYDELVSKYAAQPEKFSHEDLIGMLQLARYNGDPEMSGIFSSAAFDGKLERETGLERV